MASRRRLVQDAAEPTTDRSDAASHTLNPLMPYMNLDSTSHHDDTLAQDYNRALYLTNTYLTDFAELHNNETTTTNPDERLLRTSHELVRDILGEQSSTQDISPSGELYRAIDRHQHSIFTGAAETSQHPLLPPPRGGFIPWATALAMAGPVDTEAALMRIQNQYLLERPNIEEVARYPAILSGRFAPPSNAQRASEISRRFARRRAASERDRARASDVSGMHAVEGSNARNAKRRKVEPGKDGSGGETGFRYGRYGQVEPGKLNMEIHRFDGRNAAQASESGAGAMLKEDNDVYFSRGSQCDLVLRHQGGSVFNMTELSLKAPWYHRKSTPLRELLIFTSMEDDETLQRTERYRVEFGTRTANASTQAGHGLEPHSVLFHPDGTTSTNRITWDGQGRAPMIQLHPGGEDVFRHARLPPEFRKSRAGFKIRHAHSFGTTNANEEDDADSSDASDAASPRYIATVTARLRDNPRPPRMMARRGRLRSSFARVLSTQYSPAPGAPADHERRDRRLRRLAQEEGADMTPAENNAAHDFESRMYNEIAAEARAEAEADADAEAESPAETGASQTRTGDVMRPGESSGRFRLDVEDDPGEETDPFDVDPDEEDESGSCAEEEQDERPRSNISISRENPTSSATTLPLSLHSPQPSSLQDAETAAQIATQNALRAVHPHTSSSTQTNPSSPTPLLLTPLDRFWLHDDELSQCRVKFDPPVAARFVVLKMWSRSSDADVRLAVERVEVRGLCGPRLKWDVQVR